MRRRCVGGGGRPHRRRRVRHAKPQNTGQTIVPFPWWEGAEYDKVFVLFPRRFDNNVVNTVTGFVHTHTHLQINKLTNTDAVNTHLTPYGIGARCSAFISHSRATLVTTDRIVVLHCCYLYAHVLPWRKNETTPLSYLGPRRTRFVVSAGARRTQLSYSCPVAVSKSFRNQSRQPPSMSDS